MFKIIEKNKNDYESILNFINEHHTIFFENEILFMLSYSNNMGFIYGNSIVVLVTKTHMFVYNLKDIPFMASFFSDNLGVINYSLFVECIINYDYKTIVIENSNVYIKDENDRILSG